MGQWSQFWHKLSQFSESLSTHTAAAALASAVSRANPAKPRYVLAMVLARDEVQHYIHCMGFLWLSA